MIRSLLRQPVAHVYTRVSTDEQIDGHSLDAQRIKGWSFFDNHLAAQGLARGELLCDEGQSAFKKPLYARKHGRRLADNSFVTTGDHIIFPTLDRGFRSMQDFCNTIADFDKRGIICHFLNLPFDMSTVFGKAFTHLITMFAEIESGIKSMRMREIYHYINEHAPQRPMGNTTGIKGLRKVRRQGKPTYEKNKPEFEVYLWFLRQAATGKYAMTKLSKMCEEKMCEVLGIEYKDSAFRKPVWGNDVRCRDIYAMVPSHRKRLEKFYGPHPEFDLPVPKRFQHLRERYEKEMAKRKARLDPTSRFSR